MFILKRYLTPGLVQEQEINCYVVLGQHAKKKTKSQSDDFLPCISGSSRQFVGFDTEIDESIIHRIWERAGEFFPVLKEVSLNDLIKSREVRVGLRPYMPGGKPVIGPVPGLSKTFFAAGHEGEGLSLALGTAEIIFNMVSENPQIIDHTPFSF